MTSIIAFRINNGNQMIVVGDTQHTYETSIKSESKIELLKDNKLLFCGSGYDSIISDISLKVNHLKARKICSKKIKEIKDEKNREYLATEPYRSYAEDVRDTEFIIIDTNNLEGNKIILLEENLLGTLDMIGSGEEKIGQVQDKLNDLSQTSYSEHTKEAILSKIIEVFDFLGKQDPYTGHPAIFNLEGFILTKNSPPIKFTIKFKHDIKKLEHYEVLEC